MRNKVIITGISLALGAYIYEVSKNLFNNPPLSNALTDLDWKRVIFMGVFGGVASYFFYKTQDKK
jgi:hypothetical protein